MVDELGALVHHAEVRDAIHHDPLDTTRVPVETRTKKLCG